MDADGSGDELHFLPLCSPLARTRGLESNTKLPVFNQDQLQRFEKRYEAEHELDEEYQQWMDIYHPQNEMMQPEPPFKPQLMLYKSS